MDAKSVSQDKPKPEDQPKPQDPIPTHRGVGAWSLWLFIAPVIYVLSIGPAAKIEQALNLPRKARSFDDVLAAIYSPVIWCAGQSPPLQHALEWYLFSVWKLK